MKKFRKIVLASALSLATISATPNVAHAIFRPILHAPIWVWYRDPEGCRTSDYGRILRCWGAGIRPESRTAPAGSYFLIGRHPVTGQYGVWLVYP